MCLLAYDCICRQVYASVCMYLQVSEDMRFQQKRQAAHIAIQPAGASARMGPSRSKSRPQTVPAGSAGCGTSGGAGLQFMETDHVH